MDGYCNLDPNIFKGVITKSGYRYLVSTNDTDEGYKQALSHLHTTCGTCLHNPSVNVEGSCLTSPVDTQHNRIVMQVDQKNNIWPDIHLKRPPKTLIERVGALIRHYGNRPLADFGDQIALKLLQTEPNLFRLEKPVDNSASLVAPSEEI